MVWAQLLTGVLAFAVALFIYGLRPLQKWRIRMLAGPRPAWLVGNAPAVLGSNQIFTFKKWSDQYGPKPFAITLAAQSMVIVPDPEDARKVLVHNPSRPDMTRGSIMPKDPNQNPNESLLWARGEQWKSLRAAWQPVFFSGSLKGYFGIMDDAAKLLVKELKDHHEKGGKYIDVQPIVQAETMSVIGQTAFGVELHTQNADTSKQTPAEKSRSDNLLKAGKDALEPLGNSLVVMLGRLFPFLAPMLTKFAARSPDRQIKLFLSSRRTLREITDGLLKDHQASLSGGFSPDKENVKENGYTNGYSGNGKIPNGHSAANGDLNSTVDLRQGVKPGSFIDLLVRGSNRATGEQFTDNQKAQQVMLMLMAGYETSANTIIFCIYLLARSCNADKQAKLTAEIDGFGKDFTPSYDDLESKLPYLDAVIKESLRLFPPAHLVLRELETEMTIRGKNLAKGQMVAVSSYCIHHDERVWGSTVEDFLPERWIEGSPDQLKKVKNNFFAFGDGPRVCPGQRFAFMEIKITLIRLLQNFSIHLGPHQEPLAVRSTITLGAKEGVFIEVHPRIVAAKA